VEPQASQPKLDPLGLKILRHWKENRPQMSQELEKQGKLHQAVQAAEEMYKDTLVEGVQKGMQYQSAEEAARPIAFLPDEEDVPHLPSNPLYPAITE
jgi:hypothetical protein